MLEYAYDGFGKAYVKTSAGKVSIDEYTGSNYGNDRLFTSREYDKETKLYYYRARYYSAEQGRFISRDPIGINDDINLYSYVGNNPLNYSDPSGLAKQVMIEATNIMNYYINYIKGLKAGPFDDDISRLYAIMKRFNKNGVMDFKNNQRFRKMLGNNDGLIVIDGKKTTLSELGNIALMKIGMEGGFSYKFLSDSALIVTEKSYASSSNEDKSLNPAFEAKINELEDEPSYKIGYYNLGDGNVSKDSLFENSVTATKEREKIESNEETLRKQYEYLKK